MAPRIDRYRFGEIVIDGQSYTADVLVFPDRVRARWWRKEGHRLAPEDVEEVFQAKPEILVIGQGSGGGMAVLDETLKRLQAAGIEVLAQGTEEACNTYNRLREERRVIAALHLTC